MFLCKKYTIGLFFYGCRVYTALFHIFKWHILYGCSPKVIDAKALPCGNKCVHLSSITKERTEQYKY